MKLINKSRKNKGFTLIELIVVVSIIIILSGFLVPKVLGYQDKAKKAKVVNTARQIFDTSMESYTEEEGVLVPAKLSTSISEVTGIASTDITVAVPSAGNATVAFNSDAKNYSVVITASTNRFSVKEGTSTGTQIYENKPVPTEVTP